MPKLLPWTALSQATRERLRAAIREKVRDKTKMLSGCQAFIWIVLMAASNFCDDRQRGRLVNKEDGTALGLRQLARICGVAPSTIVAALARFKSLGWLEQDAAGVWVIGNYSAWTVRETNSVRDTNKGVRNPNGLYRAANTTVRETNSTIMSGAGNCPAAGGLKSDANLAELEAHLRQIVTQSNPAAAPIDVKKKQETTLDNGVGVMSTGTCSENERQRPETDPNGSSLSAVSVVFGRVVGRAFDQKDHGVTADLLSEGHAAEEVTRAIEHFGRIRTAEMTRAGMRYIAPMVRKGLFKPGTPSAQSHRAPPVPSNMVKLALNPELIAQRRAQRLRQLNGNESNPEAA